jgi:hypothetical protein
VAQSIRYLKQERTFADARVATYEDERARHDASTQNSIEFIEARRNASIILWFNFSERQC